MNNNNNNNDDNNRSSSSTSRGLAGVLARVHVGSVSYNMGPPRPSGLRRPSYSPAVPSLLSGNRQKVYSYLETSLVVGLIVVVGVSQLQIIIADYQSRTIEYLSMFDTVPYQTLSHNNLISNVILRLPCQTMSSRYSLMYLLLTATQDRRREETGFAGGTSKTPAS